MSKFYIVWNRCARSGITKKIWQRPRINKNVNAVSYPHHCDFPLFYSHFQPTQCVHFCGPSLYLILSPGVRALVCLPCCMPHYTDSINLPCYQYRTNRTNSLSSLVCIWFVVVYFWLGFWVLILFIFWFLVFVRRCLVEFLWGNTWAYLNLLIAWSPNS